MPYDPNEVDFLAAMEAPSLAHPLGVDDLGRDLLSRLVYGTRISLFVGISTVAIALAGRRRAGPAGRLLRRLGRHVIMRYIDLQWAFPNILIAVYLVAVFGTGLANVIVAISLAYIDDFARIARGMVLSIKEEQYVDAAHGRGLGLAHHVAPHPAQHHGADHRPGDRQRLLRHPG